MADLPDYYTQAAISEAEAAKIKGGLDVNKSAAPVSRDVYIATDTQILYVCVVDGVWTGFDASILTQGILTLYENMAGGGKRITNIADPTAAQDAATRAYVLAQKALLLLLTGGTMSGDIAMGTNKLTGLGAPAAQNDSLRYGQAEIRNNEIAAAAEIAYEKLDLYLGIVNLDIAPGATIAYTKLFLTAQIVMADLAAAIQNAANGIVVLDASADVPDAQIPDLAAGKITSDRFPVDRLPAMTDEKIWKGTGGNVEEVDIPIGATRAWLLPELIDDVIVTAVKATVANFQANAATGTFSTAPERINDNITTNTAIADTIAEYAEVDFGIVVIIKRWRQWGSTVNNGSGEWKLQYYDLESESWQDWVTGIATRPTSDWSSYVTETAKFTTKIRLVCVVVDTNNVRSDIKELEVVY